MEYKVQTNRNVGDVVYVIDGYHTMKGVIKGVESTAIFKDDIEDCDPIVSTKYMVEMDDYRCTYSQKTIFTKDEKELYSSLNEVAEEILEKHGITAVAMSDDLGKDVFKVVRLRGEN